MNNLRWVLVTGCSTGIGYHVAHGLKKLGFGVVASARQAEDVQRLQEEGLAAIQLDLADETSVNKGFEQAVALAGGQIYGLFNNGAYGQPGAVEDLTRSVLREQFETNVFGTHQLTCLAIAHMRPFGEGRIVQDSSVLGFIALAYRGAYNASKYALEGLSDTMRLELKGTGIHVSLVEPGPIKSAFRANAYKAFQRNITVEGSAHQANYEAMRTRFTTKGPVAPFTLGPEAVLEKVVHALNSPKPKPRYYVTFPTYLFGVLKRILSIRALDRVLYKVGADERARKHDKS